MTAPRPPALSSITIAATVLIVAQAVVRAVLVARGDFYWDDLIIIGRASSHPILSLDYLGHSHDGHLMPGAFLLAGVTTVLAPLQWWLPALTLVVLQLIASLAVWRMLRIITRGPGALIALAWYLFVPMTVSAFVWWAAGLNTLPMQAAMAFIVGNAVLLTRSGPDRPDPAARRRLVIWSVIAFVVALTFFEKSLFIVPVAFVAAVLAVRAEPGVGTGDYRSSAVTVAFSRARALWGWLAGIFVAWAALFLAASTATAGAHSLGQTASLVWRSITDAIVPATVGGPWTWDRWIPSPPMGFPALWMIIAGVVLIVAVAVWSWRTRRGTVAIWLATVVYAVGAQVPVMWNRSSEATALELAQTMRYLPDTALVVAIAIALVAAAPKRGAHGGHRAATPTRGPRIAVASVTCLLVVSALVSTASFSAAWRDDPTGAYLATARASLAEHSDLVMFDQALPLEVLTPVAHPYNQISRVFGRVSPRPEFGDHTDRLMVLDENGEMVPGGVSPAREVKPSGGTCARPTLTEATDLELSGPLIDWRWTVSLSYCADRDGEIEVSLGDRTLRVPVQAGLHPVYFQLPGRGDTLRVTPVTEGLALHTGQGRVGEPIVAAYAP